MHSYPSLGALVGPGGVRFRVWAPEARRIQLVLEPGGKRRAMQRIEGGCFETLVAGAGSGTRYRYRLDGGPPYPDPASRHQPDGVHGPSAVVDPSAFRWSDESWGGISLEDLVFYELHIGTFSPEGTFEGARARLPYLKDLGVTAIELMPVADFPGRWNWGYDAAAFFAPARAYGGPDALRALVDEAHRIGLAVFLDVIYNHFGPDGAYAPAFSSRFFSREHSTPWGPAINFDGEGAAGVRGFFIENALHWLVEYHLDGLRLDATHAIVDESPTHFLRELARAVHGLPGRRRHVVAEDHRNLNALALPEEAGGFGLDGVWSDDYHHEVRRMLAGDRDGYFADFSGTAADLARTVGRGWLYSGQYARFFERPRGTDPKGIPLGRFVHFIQNHDQVGNRPFGDRMTASVPLHAYRAASAMLLFAPEMPLLFMGQEWGASSPFQFFTDHEPGLGRLIREGRKQEFRRFEGFKAEIPDPQDPATFERSRLAWDELDREPHAGTLRLYRDLLARRRGLEGEFSAESPSDGGLVLRRGRYLLLVALGDGVRMPLPAGAVPRWSSEEPRYAREPSPPLASDGWVTFPRAAALLAEMAGP